MHVWLLLFIRDVDMLTTLIDSLACFNIRLFLLYDYLALLDVYILIFVYLIHIGVIDYLYCILSCFLLSLCGDINDIPVICMTGWCMTALLLCDACISCLCGIHIYPLTFNSLVSIDFVSLNLVFDMRLVTLFALRPS